MIPAGRRVATRAQAKADTAPYKIRRTLMGWQVTVRRSGGYTFTTTHAEAVEAVAAYEVARLAAWAWTAFPTVAGGVYLVRSTTGETRHFHNHQEAALFLAALNTTPRRTHA